VLKAWWFQRVFNNLRHFDNTLLQSIAATLLPWSVSDEARLSVRTWYCIWLGGFNFTVDQLF
jgi:hypothetical protein